MPEVPSNSTDMNVTSDYISRTLSKNYVKLEASNMLFRKFFLIRCPPDIFCVRPEFRQYISRNFRPIG